MKLYRDSALEMFSFHSTYTLSHSHMRMYTHRYERTHRTPISEAYIEKQQHLLMEEIQEKYHTNLRAKFGI